MRNRWNSHINSATIIMLMPMYERCILVECFVSRQQCSFFVDGFQWNGKYIVLDITEFIVSKFFQTSGVTIVKRIRVWQKTQVRWKPNVKMLMFRFVATNRKIRVPCSESSNCARKTCSSTFYVLRNWFIPFLISTGLQKACLLAFIAKKLFLTLNQLILRSR